MLTISDDYQPSKTIPVNTDFEGAKSTPLTRSLLSSGPIYQHANPTVLHPSESQRKASGDHERNLFQLPDIPLLVSDNEEESSDSDSLSSSKTKVQFSENVETHVLAAEAVKRSIKEEKGEKSLSTPADSHQNQQKKNEDDPTLRALIVDELSKKEAPISSGDTSQEMFRTERGKVMKIIVKYVAMKITNSFPPPSSRTDPGEDIPLDEFLMILSSRLQLTLPLFMKGIIYLFRYMDIIYLLRYFNQSNNFANYTDMGYGLKKLLIGCFRLVLAKERVSKDWSGITGLSNKEINSIVKTLVGRLNGKLMIKDVELVKLRSEMFRFVKMVTKTV